MSPSMLLYQNCPMSLLLFISLFFLLDPTPCSARHSINININVSTLLQFSSLAWDPIARHFVVGSILDSAVYAIPKTGMVKCLFSEPSFNNSGVSVTAVAVDHVHRRLIVSYSNHSSITAYDLKSYKKIFEVLLPELDDGSSGVAVDLESGEVFVSSARRGVVLKIGSEGGRWRVISEFKIPGEGDQGLSGLVHSSQGYIITVQPTTKKIFKVDYVKRTIKEVLSEDSINLLAPSAHAIALRTNSSIAVATNHTLLLIKSSNTWKQAANTMIIKLGRGKTVVAVAMRQGTTFLLTKSQGGYWIEEVFWGEFFQDLKYWCSLYILLLWFGVLCWLMWQWSCTNDELDFTQYGHGEQIVWREICSWFQKK